MGEITKIEWCHHTFNPWEGCTKVAPECAHCYAEARDVRYHQGDNWGPLRVLHHALPEPRTVGKRLIHVPAYFRKPIQWAKEAREAGERRRVFCMSLGDILEDRDEVVDVRKRTLDIIDQTTDALDWLLLTKRPENAALIPDDIWRLVWAGASAGTNDSLARVWPHLRHIPAHIRFLSAEPLLEDVYFGKLNQLDFTEDSAGAEIYPLRGMAAIPDVDWRIQKCDWLIVGGESGPGARPCDVAWIRSAIRQCRAAKVPVFVKQLGAFPVVQSHWDAAECPAKLSLVDKHPLSPWRIHLADRKGGDISKWPLDLRVREIPEVRHA